jgi:hypothetical protein
MNTLRLRDTVCRYATPLKGAASVARQSRFHDAPRFGLVMRQELCAGLWS